MLTCEHLQLYGYALASCFLFIFLYAHMNIIYIISYLFVIEFICYAYRCLKTNKRRYKKNPRSITEIELTSITHTIRCLWYRGTCVMGVCFGVYVFFTTKHVNDTWKESGICQSNLWLLQQLSHINDTYALTDFVCVFKMSCKSACVCKRQRETVNDKHIEQSMSECIFVDL